ncbi:hypothetical protein S2M10_33790 [Sphingomonas sp. S2M10]|uniref:pilus assembly FimT family protein n=1 Tax=Sphingomonas sp. S2M10 TaxID=2705010 RepID=UPI001456C3F2|nr:prepilin-type N-terminal cleavage/methylation domain-containing protein [Sphingomonas sp. S2M10]NLS28369.1 hypothetical protein [Sphingomonas sp. S2M10]
MSAAGNPAGFTLIEVLVTLAIAGLISAIAFPSLERALRRQAFLDASMRVEAVLRSARADAVGGGQAVRLRLSPDGHGLADGDTVETVPDDLALRLPADGVAFFPDGSARGGDLTLAGAGMLRRWRVAGGTGRVERIQ